MKRKSFMLWEKAALTALCAALLAASWAAARHSEISHSLIRLHVLAASDAPQEQEIKLSVRDAVLETVAPLLDGVCTAEQAREVLSDNIEAIRSAASAVSEGRAVRVTLGRESYPIRHYEGFTLPAGEYESLRVILGSGEGKNWWCVAFPPLCTCAAGGERLRQTMSEDSFAVITEGETQLRFRIVELWGELMQKLR